MTDTTPRAGAPLLAAAQAQKHVTHNEALYQFDALLCTRFLDRDLSAPPLSPTTGDTYLVKATGTGVWAAQDGKIAYCADGAWRFYAPFAGLVGYVADETALIVFDGSAWADYGSLISVQNIPRVGVNTMADSTNRLSVQSEAALFSGLPTSDGGSGDMRVTLSKQASANTATLLFQDNFSGRAEIGLAGDDDFHFKVSPDGAAWFEALCLAGASGVVSLPLGQLKFPATANPSADANTLDDYEEGVFTPTIFGETTAGSNTYTTQLGSYTKIGNRVFFDLYVRLSVLGGTLSGNVAIGGLPFAAVNLTGYASTLSIWSGGTTLPSGCSQFTATVTANSNVIELFGVGSNSTAHIVQSNLTNATQFQIAGSYRIS